MDRDKQIDDALRDPALYGGAGPVDVRETHISRVFLAGDRAYKLKKPVRLSFVDYGSPERRRRMCEEEVRLNRRLAPDIYLGVRAIVPADGGFALAAPGAEGAVEHVVEMRRFDEAATLSARLEAGLVTDADLERVAHVIARFHAGAERSPLDDAAERLRAAIDDSLQALEGLDGAAALRRFADSWLRAGAGLLHERGRLAVDGHADLRAEHVLLEDPVQIVDCVEFDRDLRVRDPASDLAFLTMDVESLGYRGAARELVDRYRRAGLAAKIAHALAVVTEPLWGTRLAHTAARLAIAAELLPAELALTLIAPVAELPLVAEPLSAGWSLLPVHALAVLFISPGLSVLPADALAIEVLIGEALFLVALPAIARATRALAGELPLRPRALTAKFALALVAALAAILALTAVSLAELALVGFLATIPITLASTPTHLLATSIIALMSHLE
jgi:aminoglycoside phosphotransferase family enzyme